MFNLSLKYHPNRGVILPPSITVFAKHLPKRIHFPIPMEPESTGTLDSCKSLGISVNQYHGTWCFSYPSAGWCFASKLLEVGLILQNLVGSIKWGCSFRKEIGASKKMKDTQLHHFLPTNRQLFVQFPNPQDLLQD